jgi:hypothetical protein
MMKMMMMMMMIVMIMIIIMISIRIRTRIKWGSVGIVGNRTFIAREKEKKYRTEMPLE